MNRDPERLPRPGAGRVIKSEVADAHAAAEAVRAAAVREAEAIVERAHREAEALLASALAEAAVARSSAAAQGYADGMATWTREILAAARRERERGERSRDDLVRLALRVARKILGREIETDAATVGDLVLQALRGLQRDGQIRVHLRPEDFERIQAQRGRIAAALGSNVELEFVHDSAIEMGGCRVETPFGIVDATLETQLRVLEEALLGTPRT